MLKLIKTIISSTQLKGGRLTSEAFSTEVLLLYLLFWNDQLVLQQRKHPAFDGFWDLTFSSHQIYKNNTLISDQEAINEVLKREWNIDKNSLKNQLNFLGKIYYQARDPKSIYTEHEIDYIFTAELKYQPTPNPQYAYQYQLVKKSQITYLPLIIKNNLAPWVKKSLKKLRQILNEVSIYSEKGD